LNQIRYGSIPKEDNVYFEEFYMFIRTALISLIIFAATNCIAAVDEPLRLIYGSSISGETHPCG